MFRVISIFNDYRIFVKRAIMIYSDVYEKHGNIVSSIPTGYFRRHSRYCLQRKDKL